MKISAIESYALPPGSMVREFRVVDRLGFDHQICLYKADNTQSGASVMLYEYLPSSLAVRGTHGIVALHGKSQELTRALASYTTRLRAAALVGHPALPTLDDIWQEHGTVYAVGPWRPGRSLSAELATRSAAPDAQTLTTWTRAICDALSALHRHELVHGNLSPDLLRVLDTGELQLPLIGSGSLGDNPPGWMAPEQHPLNPKPAETGPWTDVYQLSAALHLAMTGHPPPPVSRRWEGVPLERLALMAGRYPDELLAATRRGLSMHAPSRPASTEQWLQDAGVPDRRERPRYDQNGDSAGPDSTSLGPDSATRPVTAPAPLNALPTNSGHMPLSETVEERLEQVERKKPEPLTPPWVWMSALAALGALTAIVLFA